jgi:peptidoglycan/xylan/chitin deacetylase (PgdA/CDA1 family)
MREFCSACSADSLADEQVVEHACGLMDARSAFADGCPKCNRSTADDTFEPVETIARCTDCGHWQAPSSTRSVGPLRPVAVTFPDLPVLGQSLTWLPAWLVPNSERRQQFLSSAIVVMVLMAGITGALVTSPLLEATPAASEAAADPDWEEYDSIVIFRNDDIQPWYNTEEMRAVDAVFIEEEVPVTLGIIPNPGGELPITDDEATCEYLGSLETDYPKQFEMALHGYTHEEKTDFYNGSEFGGVPYETQAEWLADGERLLGECVDSPSKTFIPPMNTYDDNTTRLLAEENYTVVSGGDWFTDGYYERDSDTDAEYFEAGGMLHVPENQAFENWGEHDGTSEVPFEDTETLTNSFDETHEENGVHVQMLHYQYFTTDERLEQLQELIQHMKSTDGVGFMTVEQFANGLENGTVERTDDGWRVLEPIEHTSTEDEEAIGDEMAKATAKEDAQQ